MKKILLLDTNQAFTSDVESRLILDSIDDADIIIGTNFDNVSIDIEKYKPTELVLNTALLSARPDWKIGSDVMQDQQRESPKRTKKIFHVTES